MTRGALPCQLWGIVNVTPDSFSDGGLCFEPSDAIAHGLRLAEQGAHVLDVGGESTRPAGGVYGAGATPVSIEEELRRVLPVIEGLYAALRGRGARISIDTTKAEVATAALAAGASIVNDVSTGRQRALVEAAVRANAELVLMHNRGNGETAGANTAYQDPVDDVRKELLAAAERAQAWGVKQPQLWLDPGLGFAKTAEQSRILLANVRALVDTGYRIMVGASRKAFLASMVAADAAALPPASRLPGSLAAALHAARAGAAGLRVHDVAATGQALKVWQALEVQQGL